MFGLGYTVHSEWIDVEVRHTWACSHLMPRLPLLGTGVSPLLQWILILAFALIIGRRRARTGCAGSKNIGVNRLDSFGSEP